MVVTNICASFFVFVLCFEESRALTQVYQNMTDFDRATNFLYLEKLMVLRHYEKPRVCLWMSAIIRQSLFYIHKRIY